MVWGFCVYFVYMIPLETDVLRKHRFQKGKPLARLPGSGLISLPLMFLARVPCYKSFNYAPFGIKDVMHTHDNTFCDLLEERSTV